MMMAAIRVERAYVGLACVTTHSTHLGPYEDRRNPRFKMHTGKFQSRRLCRALAFTAIIMTFALGACTTEPAPTSYSYQPDPVLMGHSQWCGTNPASGYCDIRDRR
jgi:hypothetical protein